MCRGDCRVIRCPAVPDTDWSAFTWRWRSPAAAAFPFNITIDNGTPEPDEYSFSRQVQAVDRSMIHPGECACLWLVPIQDLLVNLGNSQQYPSPCIGSLQRIGQTWQLTIARWYWSTASDWWFDDKYLDWRLDEEFANDCSYRWGGYAGWTPYGWWGYGWAYGWGYGWGFYGGNYSQRASYLLNGSKLFSDGSDNVFSLNDFGSDTEDTNPDDWDDPQYWPSTVTLSRIGKTGGLA